MIHKRLSLLILPVIAASQLLSCRAPATVTPPPPPAAATATRTLPPIPTASVTTASVQTQPAASPTVAQTPVALLSGSPESYLPAASDLPADVVLQEASSGTNEEIAQQFENPADVLERLEAWGRLNNFMQIYGHKSGCAAPELREIYLQVVLYETPEGASQALDWYLERNQEDARQKEETSAVGEKGHILWLDETSSCTPPDPLAVVSIGFRRRNALGFVDVSRTASAAKDPNMETLALRLAQIIDYHFFEDTQ